MKTIQLTNIFHSFKFFLLIIVVSTIAPAALGNDTYTISPYIDLSSHDLAKNTWLPPIAIQNNENLYYLSDSKGKLYRSVGQILQTEPILDFSKHLEKKTDIKFTAITLHPNFHITEQQGTNILYTSHIEVNDSTVKASRLRDGEKNNYLHDSVIIEWQLSHLKNDSVSIINKREILRIGTDTNSGITQLSFNPFLKTWSDNFGFLFIAFSADKKQEQIPLYSGVILRINPHKFGLRSYTSPKNNPFIKSPYIKNEIVISGAQQIKQFTWSKHTKNKLIVSHTYNDQHLITLSPLGTDFLLEPETVNVVNANHPLNQYSNEFSKGRMLPQLWNKLIFLTHEEETWQLYTLHISKNEKSDQEKVNNKLALDMSSFPLNHDLALFIPKEDELLIWDKTSSIIYKVMSSTLTLTTEKSSITNSQKSSFPTMLILSLAAILAICILFIKLKYNQLFSQNKTLLRSNFAKIQFSENSNDLLLFRRHETEIDTTINILDICASEIFLNDTSINQVTSYKIGSFNEKAETKIRISFEQEQRDKMIDDKVRKINLKITTVKGEEFLICVYLREGNQRLTKEKYHTVIEQLIDWQWYLSSKINKLETPKRAPKPVIILKRTKVPEKSITINDSQNTGKVNPTTDVTPLTKNKIKSDNKTPTSIDTKLVEALNKLVLLKEQGYLTEDEFNLAKQNLLSSLSSID